MKKNILSLSFLFFILCGCFAQSVNYPISEKPKGNVHIIEETCTFYVENGRIIIEQYIKKFDKQGRIVEKQTLDRNQFIQYWEIFKYARDEEDYVKWYRYDTDERHHLKEVRTKSEPGSHEYVFYNREKTGTIKREWNEKEIKITNYHPGAFMEPVTDKTILYENNRPVYTQRDRYIEEFQYNEKGDCIQLILTKEKEHEEEDSQEPEITTTLYTYEYDSTGNWIKQTCKHQETDTLLGITERTITYY
ncbi:MAG: hypothetical protein LIP01_05845 [Tannerellaceae bacterium]|nr:hypothetical protein [Tannerellaceae bacterium]